jgi:hypothetical protein
MHTGEVRGGGYNKGPLLANFQNNLYVNKSAIKHKIIVNFIPKALIGYNKNLSQPLSVKKIK